MNVSIPNQINITNGFVPRCEQFEIHYNYNLFIAVNFIVALMLFYHRKLAKTVKQEPQRILAFGITLLAVFNTVMFLFQFLIPVLNNWLVGI